MIRTTFVLAAWIGISAQVFSQTTPRFEVASIRPCNPADLPPGGGRGGGQGVETGADPERMRIVCQTLEGLMRWAYISPGDSAIRPMRDRPIQGGPSWLSTERFTINAKAESPQSVEMMRGPMLRALLEDRFKLKVHRETEQIPIYALVVAKGGPKLVAAKRDSCTPPPDFSKGLPPPLRPDQPPPCEAFSADKNGGTRTYGQSMAGLCAQFSALLDRDVEDRTGIRGTFDIHLEASYYGVFGRIGRGPFAEPQADTVADAFNDLANAVLKLGLRLESAKGKATSIVIDRVERPSEN